MPLLDRRIGLVIAALIASFAGCGPPEYCRVSGIVTHNGKPVPFLQIRLAPVILDSGRPPLAMSDKDGKFEMTTGRTVGVKNGEYTVHIEDPVAVDGAKTSTDPDYLYCVDKYSPKNSALKLTIDHHLDNFELVLE
ncbi:MAG: hypothetical protein KDB03_14850 [Planctomycetales bacterium]|nr:hypothetical protein [Planctomycetales bacterium]